MPSKQQALEELSKIVDLFSTQSFPETLKKVYIETYGKPCSKWSMGNKVLMITNGTMDARGFKDWIKVGRYVKKGTRAFYILAPWIVDKKEINSETKQEKITKSLIGFLSVPVFRYEDTEGKAIETYKPKSIPPLMDLAKKWGMEIQYSESFDGSYGSFSPSQNKIVLSTEDQGTFFHELTHKVHSKIEKLKGGQDQEQEAIAQLTSCVLSKLYGFNDMAYSYSYIASYAKSNKPEAVGKLCLRVLSKVQTILNLIIDESETMKQKEVITN